MVVNGRRALSWIFSLKVYVSVLQIWLKATARGASIAVDASRFHINPLECYDRTTSCAGEIENGFCDTNVHYMIDRCPWSCRFCKRAEGSTKKCKDLNKGCAEWASHKECKTRPEFMAQNCKKSCELCGSESEYKFTDLETACPDWAKAGGCQKYPDLLQKCPHSCKRYTGLDPSSSTEHSLSLQNSSSVVAQNSSQIPPPPLPSARIRPLSDLNTLPVELRKDLEKEWWNDKLLKLNKKQNEYVTHIEPRPPSLPVLPVLKSRDSNHSGHSNETQSINCSLVIFRPNSQDEIQQNESGIPQADLSPAPPRTYDALVPQLAVSGPISWPTGTGIKGYNEFNSTGIENNANAQEIWKEEKEEDLDLEENGQQKGTVPLRFSGDREESENRDTNNGILESGSGKMHDSNSEKSNGEVYLKIDFSGSGEETQRGKMDKPTDSFGRKQGKNVRNFGRETVFSGSGEGKQATKTDEAENASESKQIGEGRKLDNGMYFSGSGEERQESRLDIDVNFSGSGED